MIGAIVLTYRKREGVKKQSYINQISRERKTSIDIVEADFNTGVKIDD
jgi:NADH-quinone oxidoreductase subunit J